MLVWRGSSSNSELDRSLPPCRILQNQVTEVGYLTKWSEMELISIHINLMDLDRSSIHIDTGPTLSGYHSGDLEVSEILVPWTGYKLDNSR